MSKTIEQIRSELDAKIPRDAIAQREGGGRSKLSYLEGWYVIDRMNQVLGQGNWSYATEEMRLVFSGEVGDKQVAHYVANVSLTVRFPGAERSVSFTDFGYGDGQDKYNPGKAHELAVKEAVTDGIKRCAKNLGMSMGLALYDKTQENVDDGQETSSPAPSPANRAPAPATKLAAVPAPAKNESVAPVAPQSSQGGDDLPEAPPSDRAKLNELIGFMSKVINSKRIKTIPELKSMMATKYGADSKEKLSDDAAKKCYVEFRAMIA